MNKIQKNELSSKFLGVCSLNPQHIHDSSARLQMLSQHLGQMLVIKGSTTRQLQTGMERQFGKYTYRVEMPCDGVVLDIIERYPSMLSEDAIESNPQTIVIYEDTDTKEIGMINLVDYCSNHQYFGFRYKGQSGLNQIRVGAFIPKGTVFLDSPSITDEGDYKYGVQANVAFMSHPACAEDGVAVSDTFLQRLGFKTFENRVVEWGRKRYALNLYGDENHYKPFPDIGSVIRPDGLLMALRDFEPSELAVVEQSVNACRKVDFTFDTTIYANGEGGRIIDIRINHDSADHNCAEKHMDAQPQKYDNARRRFYKRLLDLYISLRAKRGEFLQITPELHQLIVAAQSVISEGGKQRVTKLYRKAPLDAYRIEFVIEYDIVPSIGFKVTDLHGGKGVICQVIKESEMPVDADGNRADFLMDPNSTINRANPGRLFEQYYNASARDTHKRLCAMMGVKPFTKEVTAYNQISKLGAPRVKECWDYLMNFYGIVSPQMVDWFVNGQITATQEEFLSEIAEKGIGLFLPPDNQPVAQEVVMLLEKQYPPTYGPVSYIGNSGVPCVTTKPIRIAPVYIILLEKTGDDWSAVSSGKLQLFGVLSQLTKADKYSRPARNQSVRVAGEGEIRLFLSNCGERFTAEIMDRNNNPAAHKEVVRGLFKTETPGNVQNLVNRHMIPYGGSKALQLLKHLCQVSGFTFVYDKHKVNESKIGEP